jgi:hypothetical protein
MATQKPRKSTAWMDDGDDAHFDGNPAYRKRSTKKRVVGQTKSSDRSKMKISAKSPTRRKRVAGKK